jgi:predicted metal-dependent hydrolase
MIDRTSPAPSTAGPACNPPLPPQYLGYFECFNAQRFFEAHEVLEELWLPQRREPNGDFFKGLIQLAGAFVHLQKRRPDPAVALLQRAHSNLAKYPSVHHSIDVGLVLNLIERWRDCVNANPRLSLTVDNAPQLALSVQPIEG